MDIGKHDVALIYRDGAEALYVDGHLIHAARRISKEDLLYFLQFIANYKYSSFYYENDFDVFPEELDEIRDSLHRRA